MPESPLLKKRKNSFLLRLNRSVYRETLVNSAIKGESWISKSSSGKDHICLKFDTPDRKKVLEFSNYLLYMNRTS